MIINVDNNIQLRHVEKSDARDIFETIDREREYLKKWLPFIDYMRDIFDVEEFLNSIINSPKERLEFVFTIRVDNEFAGLIGLKNTDIHSKKTEIGYWLSERYQKQGIMTKSVSELCDFAFNSKGMNRIQIKCAVGNTYSKNIPKKLGFIFEGIEREGELLSGNIYTDLEIYSKLKSDK